MPLPPFVYQNLLKPEFPGNRYRRAKRREINVTEDMRDYTEE
jgi:hypothetical protein